MFFLQPIILRCSKNDVTVNSYNNFYLFSMKYLYRNDSIWKFVAIFCHTTSLIPSFSSNIFNFFFFSNGCLSLKFENFAVLSKNIHYYFDNKNFWYLQVTIHTIIHNGCNNCQFDRIHNNKSVVPLVYLTMYKLEF
jgi:hypothetical protein